MFFWVSLQRFCAAAVWSCAVPSIFIVQQPHMHVCIQRVTHNVFHVTHNVFHLKQCASCQKIMFHLKQCASCQNNMFHLKKCASCQNNMFHLKQCASCQNNMFHLTHKVFHVTHNMFHLKQCASCQKHMNAGPLFGPVAVCCH